MDIKTRYTCIDMINIDKYHTSTAENKKNNINKLDEFTYAKIRKDLKEVCKDKLIFSNKISDIYKEANNNNLQRKKDIRALSAMKEAINSLPKSEISAMTMQDYDKDDLINLFSGRNAPEDKEKTEFINARALFDISAHKKLSAPDRPYFTKEKIISGVTNFVTLVGATAGYLSDRWLDSDMHKKDSAGIKTGSTLGVVGACNLLSRTYVEWSEHTAKLGDEKNSAIFKCTQSLAKTRLKGMELFETKHIAPTEFKLDPS